MSVTVMLVDPLLAVWRMPGVQSCMCNWSWTRTGVVGRGSMGSGSAFSLWTDILCEEFEALDIGLVMGIRMGGWDERGWVLIWCFVVPFMCELDTEFEEQNSAISSWALPISSALTHWLSELGYPFHSTKYCFFFQRHRYTHPVLAPLHIVLLLPWGQVGLNCNWHCGTPFLCMG